MSASTISIQVERSIQLLRDQRVMFEFQLAELYQVETRALKQAVRRNLDRFPADFIFELTSGEINDLVSQNVIPTLGKLGGATPMAFSEQGVSMLSSVLRSDRAVQVNIAIMRAFVRLREMLASNTDLVRKLENMEKKHDGQFRVVFDAIRQLMTPPIQTNPRDGLSYTPQAKACPQAPAQNQRKIINSLSTQTNHPSPSNLASLASWR